MWGDAPGRVWSLMGEHSFDLLLKFWPLEPATSVGEGSGKGGDERVEAARVGERREGVGTREDTGERNRCEPRTGGEAAGERESERRVVKTDWRTGNAAGRQMGWPGQRKGTGLRGAGREAWERVAWGPRQFLGPQLPASSARESGLCAVGPMGPPFWSSSPVLPGGGISLVSSADGWCLMVWRFQQVSGQGFTEGIKWPKGWGQGEASSSHPEVSWGLWLSLVPRQGGGEW